MRTDFGRLFLHGALFGVLLITILMTAGAWEARSDIGVDSPAQVVKKIEIRRLSNGSEMVSVFLDGFHVPNIFSLDGGNPRVVCDFAGVKPGPGLALNHDFSGKFIRSVRVAYHRAPSPKLRIVLDLVPDIPIDVSPYFFQKERLFSLTLSELETTAP